MPFFRALTALSTSGPVASRAFMPLFIVSLLASERTHAVLRKIDIFAEELSLKVPENMAWLGSDEFIIAVGILALLEVLADKNDDIKELMERVQVGTKTVVGMLVALAILPPETTQALSTTPVEQAGFGDLLGWKGLVVVGTATLTYFLAKFRASVFGSWFELDDEDDFNLRKVISFMEDLWSIVAIPFFIVFPVLAAFIVVLLFGVILAGRKLVSWLEDRRRMPCGACEFEILPTASTCPKCKDESAPSEILSWNLLFGRRVPVLDGKLPNDAVYKRHRLRLISRRRCPQCAERLDPRILLSSGCGKCGYTLEAVDNPEWYNDYRKEVIGRAYRMLVPLLLLSWVPAIGIALAVVAVKLFLSAPLRMFLGSFSRFGLKWGMRLFTLILLILGSLPFVSLVAVPILMLTHIWVYSSFAKKRIMDGVDDDTSGNEATDVSQVQQV